MNFMAKIIISYVILKRTYYAFMLFPFPLVCYIVVVFLHVKGLQSYKAQSPRHRNTAPELPEAPYLKSRLFFRNVVMSPSNTFA